MLGNGYVFGALNPANGKPARYGDATTEAVGVSPGLEIVIPDGAIGIELFVPADKPPVFVTVNRTSTPTNGRAVLPGNSCIVYAKEGQSVNVCRDSGGADFNVIWQALYA